MTESKKWYTSKTLWINAALAVAAVVLDEAPEGVEWVAIANMILRYLTTKAVTL